MKKLLILIIAIFIENFANAQWQQTNGPFGGGSVSCFAMNGSNIFAGTEFNGVFLSTNNGSNWTAINNGLTNLNVKALIVIGTNIYAGTYGGGIFVSSNNGISWTAANTGLTHTYITSFAVSGSNFYAGTMGGVFLSTNNGSSWTAINNGISKYIYCLAASGSNVYAGTIGGVYKSTNSGSSWTFHTVSYGDIVNSIAFCGNFIYAATLGHGVYASSNGSSWSVSTPYPGYIYNIYTLAVSGTNIYAGTGGGLTGGSILFSSNGGASWVTLKDSIFVQSLLISGSNIFAGTTKGVYLSPNNGSNWSVTNNGLINNSVSILVSNGTNIFAGTLLGGVFRSINNGANWTETSYLSNVTSLTIEDTIIYAGTGGGVLKSANYGNSWTSVASGGTNQVNSIVVKGSNIFAGTPFGVFLIANGSGWTAINNGLTTLLVRSLVLNGNDIIAGTAGGVFLSSDNGSSWTAKNNGLINLNVKTLVASGTNIFAGTAGGVFLSSDNGSSWTAINNGLTNLNILSLNVKDSNVFASTNAGVFFSSNYGNTWTAANNGLINNIVQSFAICGANVFAGTNGNGVWKNSSFLCSYPTIPASGFTVSNVTAHSTTIGWTRGNGNRTIVLSKAGSAVNSNPFDGNFYSANSIFGNGTQIGNGNYVIYNGIDTSINITGLSAGTNYYFAVYEFDTTSNCYLSNALTGNLTTICIPLSIIVQPVSLQTSYLPSSNILFNVKVGGNSTSAYQWQYYNGTTWNSVVDGMPAGAIYNNTTADSMTVSGITTVGTYQYRCYISNCNGVNTVTSNISTLIVSPLPSAATTITGSSTVCQGQNNVVYTVSPITNATSYIWTLPPGATGSSTTNTISVNYDTSAASGNITVKGSNTFGIGDSSILAVTVNVLPDSAGVISGITTVCQGQNSITYTTPTITNATSYTWTLPSGVTGASTTNSITVNYGNYAVSGNIIVKGINACGAGISSSLFVNINPLPSSSGFISGPTNVCKGQTNIYSVSPIANANSYIWTLPSGVTGASDSNSINGYFGLTATNGNITVKGINSCGIGATSAIAIYVNQTPSAAGNITGQTNVCQGQNSIIYSVPPIANASFYEWTLPSGVTGTSLTDTIYVDYGNSAISGNITVKGINSNCYGDSSSLAVIVNLLPSSASLITGTINLTAGQQNVQYSIPAIANATSYVWTLPNGASGTSTTNTITVNYSSSAVSGNITVKGVNSCGIGDSSSLYITVNPFIPNCSAQFDLVADTAVLHHYFVVNNASGIPPLQYNWSWGDGSFSTTAYPTHTYSASGNYKICLTIIDSVGCTTTYCDSSYLQKDPNAIISVQVIPQGSLGIKNLVSDKIKIYPNPAKDNLIIESNISQNSTISIYNIQGQLCRQIISNQSKTEMDIKDLSAGLYVIKLNNAKESFVSRFVKE